MVNDLFTFHSEEERKRNAPLAERLRPTTLEEFCGQQEILGEGRLLRRAIETDRVGNLLLQGPPGIGKTTLARIIALNTRAHFSVLNAVLAGVKDLREEIQAAKQRLGKYGLRTILFIDEVHRFNTLQQDALLPWVENGTFTFIGATTENPLFEVNQALVSRSRIFRLNQLSPNDLSQLLHRALNNKEEGYGNKLIYIDKEAANHLINVANGDARTLLNALELAVETTLPDEEGGIKIDLSIVEQSIQERALLYDKNGDIHFDTISAFIKSIRGSDPDAALFWLARMIESGESPNYIFRRMLISAAEDIGLADPQAIVVVESCASAFDRVGMPEGNYFLSEAVLYLACTEKSNSILGVNSALKAVKQSSNLKVPKYLRDSHRNSEKSNNESSYLYPHDYEGNWVSQRYLPENFQGEVFWQPSNNGWEGKKRSLFEQRKKRQLSSDVDL